MGACRKGYIHSSKTADASLLDGDGHPLTWGSVFHAHQCLVAHASCPREGGPSAGTSYDSDTDGDDAPPCPCTWHGVMIDELVSHRLTVSAWPGRVCGTCWAASCRCGYVFDSPHAAAGREHNGR